MRTIGVVLALVFINIMAGGNLLSDLRAVYRPYSIDEIKGCLLSLHSEELVFDLEEANLAVAGISRGDVPISVVFSSNNHPSYSRSGNVVSLAGSYTARHLSGCDEQAVSLAHELQHALNEVAGVPRGIESENRAFSRQRSVRFNFPYDGTIDPFSAFIIDLKIRMLTRII